MLAAVRGLVDASLLPAMLVFLLVLASFMSGVAVTLACMAMLRVYQTMRRPPPRVPIAPEPLAGVLGPDDADRTETLPGGENYARVSDADNAATEIVGPDRLRELGLVLDTTEETAVKR